MKNWPGLLVVLMSIAGLQACGGGGNLLDEKDDTAPLIPQEPPAIDPNAPRPSDSAKSMSSVGGQIVDVGGTAVLLRGINLHFGDNPTTRMSSIDPIATTGSNVVRLVLSQDTTETALENALLQIVENNMIAMVTLAGDEGELACTDNDTFITQAMDSLWLGEWLPILAQDRFQPHLMINIASKWGPMNVFNASSRSYSEYIDTYKVFIRKFRNAGLKMPLVIDAPHCGEDYNAFLGGRANELRAADSEANVVMSAHAFGGYWNSPQKIRSNVTALQGEGVPYVITEFGGSGYGGESAIDHIDLMNIGAGDGAWVLDIPWSQTIDKGAYVMDLPSPIGLAGATIGFDVNLDKDYVDDENLGITLYVKDGEYRYANFGLVSARSLRRGNWKRVEYSVTSADDITGYKADGFDITAIRQLGFEFVANGKPVDVAGEIKIDNLTITLGATPEPEYQATFDSSAESWYHGWGVEPNIAAQDGALSITPDWSAGNETAIRVESGIPAIDFTQALSVTVRAFIPEEYAGQTTMFIKLFAQYGDGWAGWGDAGTKGLSDFTAGQWNELVYNATNLLNGASSAHAMGLQIGSISGSITSSILIDSVTVTRQETSAPSSAMYAATFDSDVESWELVTGWGALATPEFVQQNGALSITPDWSQGSQIVAQRAGIKSVNTIDLSGPFIVRSRIFVDGGYAGSDFWLKFFLQDGDNWTHADAPAISMAELTPDGWTTVDFLIDVTSPDFDRSLQPNMFGFQFGGTNLTGGAVLFDDIEILGEGEAPAETVLSLTFESEAEVMAFSPDFSEGGLTAGALAGATRHGLGIEPFGWIAWNWIGSEGDAAVLNLSTAEDTSAGLTERGDSVVNGTNGIGDTAVPAAFE